MQLGTKVLMDKCPVLIAEGGAVRPCNEPLQATVPVYFSETAVDIEAMDNGKLVVADISPGVHAFPADGDDGAGPYEGQEGWKVYCAEDHGLDEMLKAWQHEQDGDV